MVQRIILILSGIFLSFILLSSCGQNVDVVESGTYEGTVAEVKPDEKEIYVETKDNKTLELYFTDSTKLTMNGKSVDFSKLKKDAKVEVKIEKMGKKLNPLAVEIK